MKTVPVEVVVVLHVNEEGWRAEHGVYEDDFEDAVRDWFIDEIGWPVESAEWANVVEVTKRG